MTEFKIYKLTFQTPLHLSKGKTGSYESSDAVLHSDTIKSALYVAALQLDRKVFADKMLKELTISSAFPFDSTGCWLPRPLGFSFSDEISTNRKEQKRIRCIKA
jgi:CRISPR/Cas system CSM-associated protein Csm4 (group 5 of RAMP superfamily)